MYHCTADCHMIFSKRDDARAVAKLSLPMGCFNINEPVIFGLPIVLNPIYFIPRPITPVILAELLYGTASGLIPPVFITVPWVVPPVIYAILATGGSLMAWSYCRNQPGCSSALLDSVCYRCKQNEQRRRIKTIATKVNRKGRGYLLFLAYYKEDNMEGLELICFEIISSVGMARSLYIEAIQEAKAGNFEQAQELIKQGDESFTEGHHSHAKLIQQEAGGEATQMTLLLTHAEDQLMSAEAFKSVSLGIYGFI